MTRETKIGLLVGLAFIIVIGILLSDHMSSTSEPQAAALGSAGGNVREGVTTPGGAGDGSPISAVGAAPADAPQSPVPTRADLARPVAPRPVPAARQHGPVALVPEADAGPGGGEPFADSGGVEPPAIPGPVAARPDAPVRPGDPHELVRRHPDDFVAFGPGPVTPGRPGAAGPSAPRSYTAEAGDSVSRIAARMYGTNTKANRDLLIRANPALQAEGNPVIVGKVYVVPNLPAAPAVASQGNAGNTPPAPAPRATARRDPAPVAGAGEVWYTVKGNDNLWKIAESQLGTGNAWTTIRDLNKDVLKGGETVHPNMRIRLPAKPVMSASAN